jgi:hypothetical protein
MKLKAFCAALLLVPITTAVAAGSVYKWTDENGRTVFGDKVPENRKGKAKLVPVEMPSKQEIAAARAEARKDKARAAEAERQRNARPQVVATAGGSGDACDAQWIRFNASNACFGPYRLANGGVRPEAFQNCETVPYPTCPMPESLAAR